MAQQLSFWEAERWLQWEEEEGELGFIQFLLRVGHFQKVHNLILFSLQRRGTLLDRCGDWGSEKLTTSSRVSELLRSRASVELGSRLHPEQQQARETWLRVCPCPVTPLLVLSNDPTSGICGHSVTGSAWP